MITKWTVSNFKSIREETELDFSPLTIFAGANSSGKSTFIQSILLVAQTVAQKEQIRRGIGSPAVVLNGHLTNLGQFDELKSNGGESDQITIKFNFKFIHQPRHMPIEYSSLLSQNPLVKNNANVYGQPINLREVACKISFDANPSSNEQNLYQNQTQLFATELSCLSINKDNIDQNAYISIHRKPNNTISYPIYALDYPVEMDENSKAELVGKYHSAEIAYCALNHFLPSSTTWNIDVIKEFAKNIVLALQDDRLPPVNELWGSLGMILLSEEIIAVLRELIDGVIDSDQIFNDIYEQDSEIDLSLRYMFWQDSPIVIESEGITFKEWYDRIRDLPHEERLKIQQVSRECEDFSDRIYEALTAASVKDQRIAIRSLPSPCLFAQAITYLRYYCTLRLKYLEPLRYPPTPLYPHMSVIDSQNVGLRGEYTAFILAINKNKGINYIPSANFKDPIIIRKLVSESLEAAVIDWLQYLGVANSIESRDMGKLGHELKVGISDTDIMHDITHVGVGVSQVLPILVMCLLAEKGSTLIFEQPELHLHPKVQTLLGDFFLSMALCDKQCIVETHSEYIIDRIRFRVAASTTEDELNSQIKIYFVEKPHQSSLFREVVINEFGAISDWPEGFFDQSQKQAEEILRAAALKRKSSRRTKDA